MNRTGAMSMLAGLALLCSPAVARTDGKTYVALRAGGSFSHQTELSLRNPRVTNITDRDDEDSSTVVAFAVGRQMAGNYRLELEYGDRDDSRFRVNTIGGTPALGTDFNAVNSIRVATHAILGNAYYDFEKKGKLRPFLSLGMGMYEHRASALQVFQNPRNTGAFRAGAEWPERSESGLVLSIGGGASFELDTALHLDLGYRYLDMGEYDLGPDIVNTDERFSGDVRTHELYLGARFGF